MLAEFIKSFIDYMSDTNVFDFQPEEDITTTIRQLMDDIDNRNFQPYIDYLNDDLANMDEDAPERSAALDLLRMMEEL